MEDKIDGKIEKIIEEKVEQRVEKRVQEELEKRGFKHAEEKQQTEEEKSEDEEVSRRSFLKKLGAGALGIGAMSLSPASALNVRSNDFSVYAGNDSTREFQVNSGGPVEVQNANLEVNGSNDLNVGRNINIGESDADPYLTWKQNGTNKFNIHWDDGSNSLMFRDPENSDNHLIFNQGGPVEVKNANLDLNGNYLEKAVIPSGGIAIDSGGTQVGSIQASNTSFVEYTTANSAAHLFRYNDNSGNAKFKIGSNVGVQNANLDMNDNNITGVEKTTFNNSGNDFWRINDGSGGSNGSPHTARFDDRDMRFYAGTGVGTVWRLNQDGSVEYPEGPVTIDSNTVATRNWATSNNISHGDLSNAPSSAHHSRYSDGEARDAVTGNTLNGQVSISGPEVDGSNAPLKVDEGGSHVLHMGGNEIGNINGTLHLQNNSSGSVNVRTTLEENGSRVATRTWVDNNTSDYTDADARNAVDGSTLTNLTINGKLVIPTGTDAGL